MKNNSLGNLRAFRAAAAAVIIMLSPACTKDDVTPQPCKGGPCDAAMFFPGERDVNGYYTIDLDWNGDYYPYFSIDIHATKVDSYYEYNGVGVVEGNFDSDTTWILPESGVEVNVVQETTIYFSESPARLESKRVVGPFPPQMVGDTITINMEIFWDAGMDSVIKNYSEKFIVK
jgi:hypothetical protein